MNRSKFQITSTKFQKTSLIVSPPLEGACPELVSGWPQVGVGVWMPAGRVGVEQNDKRKNFVFALLCHSRLLLELKGGSAKVREVNFHRLCEGGGSPTAAISLCGAEINFYIRDTLPLPIAIATKGRKC